MRIGVRARCQRQGIGRKLLEYLLKEYPAHLNLDVSTDNTKATNFYHRVGLQINRTYITEEEKIEFVEFGTPEDFVYVPSSYTAITPPNNNNTINQSIVNNASNGDSANDAQAAGGSGGGSANSEEETK